MTVPSNSSDAMIFVFRGNHTINNNRFANFKIGGGVIYMGRVINSESYATISNNLFENITLTDSNSDSALVTLAFLNIKRALPT